LIWKAILGKESVVQISRAVFITTQAGETLFHEELIENEGVQVDFVKVFPKIIKLIWKKC